MYWLVSFDAEGDAEDDTPPPRHLFITSNMIDLGISVLPIPVIQTLLADW